MKKEQKLKMQVNLAQVPTIDLTEHLQEKKHGLFWWVKLIAALITTLLNILTQDEDE